MRYSVVSCHHCFSSQNLCRPTSSSRSRYVKNHSNSAGAASSRFKSASALSRRYKIAIATSEKYKKDDSFSLHTACADGNMDLVQKLLKRGTDFERKNNDGMTPLNIACGWGHADVVKALLARDANEQKRF
jgi:ankyrin repeat protein